MQHGRSGPEVQYFNMLESGVFKIQHCVDCVRFVFFPRTHCPLCGSESLHWVRPSGQGIIYSITTVRREAQQGGDYNVALVDLVEGVRVMAHVIPLPSSPAAIGDSVAWRQPDVGQEEGKLYFNVIDEVSK